MTLLLLLLQSLLFLGSLLLLAPFMLLAPPLCCRFLCCCQRPSPSCYTSLVLLASWCFWRFRSCKLCTVLLLALLPSMASLCQSTHVEASLLWRVSADVGVNVIAVVHAAAGIPAVADITADAVLVLLFVSLLLLESQLLLHPCCHTWRRPPSVTCKLHPYCTRRPVTTLFFYVISFGPPPSQALPK